MELIQSDPHEAPLTQKEKKKQTNTIKQPQNEQMASRVGDFYPTKR